MLVYQRVNSILQLVFQHRVFLCVPLGPISPATRGPGVPAPTLAIGGVGGAWTMPGWWISGGPTGGPVEQCRT